MPWFASCQQPLSYSNLLNSPFLSESLTFKSNKLGSCELLTLIQRSGGETGCVPVGWRRKVHSTGPCSRVAKPLRAGGHLATAWRAAEVEGIAGWRAVTGHGVVWVLSRRVSRGSSGWGASRARRRWGCGWRIGSWRVKRSRRSRRNGWAGCAGSSGGTSWW